MRRPNPLLLVLPLLAAPLAACHGKGTSELAKNVAEAFDNRAEQLDNLAERTTNAQEAELAREQADAMHDEGEARKKAIEQANTNAAAADPKVMNSLQPPTRP